MIGLQPTDGSQIPGIRRWPAAYLPDIYQSERVDRVMDISQSESEQMMRRLAKDEGIFAGVSSGGAVAAAMRLSAEVEALLSLLSFVTAEIGIFQRVFFPDSGLAQRATQFSLLNNKPS